MITRSLVIARNRRAGLSLVELLAAMFLFTVALSLFEALLLNVLKVGTSSADHLDRLNATARLARSLRRDVHAARRATLVDLAGNPASEPASTRLDLQLGGAQRVTYEIEAHAVHRRQFAGDSLVRKEDYTLERSAGRWHLSRLGENQVVGLRLERRLSPRRASLSRAAVIEAIVGSDLRFTRGETP